MRRAIVALCLAVIPLTAVTAAEATWADTSSGNGSAKANCWKKNGQGKITSIGCK